MSSKAETNDGFLKDFNNPVFFSGKETVTYTTKQGKFGGKYSVTEGEDGWYANSEAGKIGFIIYKEGKEPVEEATYSFYMAVHLDAAGGETTLVAKNAFSGSTGQGWGFTYFYVDGLRKGNSIPCDIVGNKKTYDNASAEICLEDGKIVIKISGITLKTDQEGAVKAHIDVNDIFADGTGFPPGQYGFHTASGISAVDGVYTIVIPSTTFDVTQY